MKRLVFGLLVLLSLAPLAATSDAQVVVRLGHRHHYHHHYYHHHYHHY